ncbi:MAG TPA: DUF6350 family protein [Pseudonocardia sp.]|nr:DUF6350 family protein [Pseudonocardia sp.]
MTSTLADTDRQPPDEPDSDLAPGGVEGLDRLRLLLAGAMGTVLLSYALLVPSAALVIVTAGGVVSVDGAFAAAIPLWLAAHQIPLVLEGQPLSVLPLLPTLGVVAVIAFGAGWSARRLGCRPRHDAGAVIAAVAGAHAAVAVLGSALLPRAAEVAVAPWSAMVGGGLVAGGAAVAGVVRACGLPPELAARLPGWLRPALRGTGVALAGLVFSGATVLLIGLVVRADALAAAYAHLAPGFGAGVGVTLLAGAYLPNAVIAALSWVLGPGIAVGAATASPFVAHTGAPSSFPLLAVLPSGMPPVWALGVFVLPVGTGVLAGLAARRAAPARHRFGAGLGTAVLTAVVAGGCAVLAGGRLATGPFDPVRVPVELLVPAVLLWVGVPIMLIAVFRSGEPGLAENTTDGSVRPGPDAHEGDATGAPADAAAEREPDAEAGDPDAATEAAPSGGTAFDDPPERAADAADGPEAGAASDRPEDADTAAGGSGDAGADAVPADGRGTGGTAAGRGAAGDGREREPGEVGRGDGDGAAGGSAAPGATDPGADGDAPSDRQDRGRGRGAAAVAGEVGRPDGDDPAEAGGGSGAAARGAGEVEADTAVRGAAVRRDRSGTGRRRGPGLIEGDAGPRDAGPRDGDRGEAARRAGAGRARHDAPAGEPDRRARNRKGRDGGDRPERAAPVRVPPARRPEREGRGDGSGGSARRTERAPFLPWRRRRPEPPPEPTAEQSGPRTVAELVALREQEAAERGERPEGGG